MTAPSLVLLGYGSPDPRVSQVSHQLRDELLEIRPELDVHVAFLEHGAPTGMSVVNRLVGQGVTEIVLVPLLLSEAFDAPAAVPALIAQAAAAHPGLRITAARPIGPEAHLLSIIDRRLRDALRARRVCELDALVFAAAGSADVRSNALVARRARQWSTHHRLPHVVSFAGGSGPEHGRGHPDPAGPGSSAHRRRQLVPGARAALDPPDRAGLRRAGRSRCPPRWAASRRSPKSR